MEAIDHFSMKTTIEPNGMRMSVMITSFGSRDERMAYAVGICAEGAGSNGTVVISGSGICSPQAEHVCVFSGE
jgi:hypothetical protein